MHRNTRLICAQTRLFRFPKVNETEAHEGTTVTVCLQVGMKWQKKMFRIELPQSPVGTVSNQRRSALQWSIYANVKLNYYCLSQGFGLFLRISTFLKVKRSWKLVWWGGFKDIVGIVLLF